MGKETLQIFFVTMDFDSLIAVYKDDQTDIFRQSVYDLPKKNRRMSAAKFAMLR